MTKNINTTSKWLRVRFGIIGMIVFAMYSTVFWKAFALSVWEADTLSELARRQHIRTRSHKPPRGPILDARHEPLALSVEVDAFYAHPNRIKDPEDAAKKVAPLMEEFTERELLKKLGSGKSFTWVSKSLKPAVADKIRKLKIEGLVLTKVWERYYPNMELAAQVIGFTGAENKGLEGLELRFNETLMGYGETYTTERDALGRQVHTDPDAYMTNQGGGIVLTLDRQIQFIVEKELKKATDNFSAKGGMAIVMEPSTGRILAMANYPTFNPNIYSAFPRERYANRSVTDPFEPGSTFKLMLLTAALNEGVVTPTDKIYCENGEFKIGDDTIRDVHERGMLSVEEVFTYSSNIGAAKIGLKLGKKSLLKYIKDFGFGAKLSLDLPGESIGIVRPYRDISRVGVANISFGQGISVTALQMITAVAAIANEGVLMRPFIVEKYLDGDRKTVKTIKPKAVRRVCKKEVAEAVVKNMVKVIQLGTGGMAAVTGYSEAGKTGTAQKTVPGILGYAPDKHVSSFVGFLPAFDSRIAILVVIDEPTVGEGYGGVVAGPVFKEIARQTLPYLGVLPFGANRPAKELAQNTEDPQNMDEVIAMLQHKIDAEERLAKLPKLPSDLPKNAKIVPDFTGLTLREALKKTQALGIDLKATGSGRAISQEPPAFTVIKNFNKLELEFAEPI